MSTRPSSLGNSLDLLTLADVDAALHELGWLAHQTQVIDGKTQTAVADRSQHLREAFERWCETALAEHLPAGAKSLTLAHGKVGRRELLAAVAFTEAADDKSVLAAVEKKTGHQAWVIEPAAVEVAAPAA